ncbi:restriction endonuclease subunit S [Flavobacterium sp. GA093]|uniref:Restriction endonuclease subunit S n=1 Tax=Flavobacterium hydrocarbonoxydans TaxID=2683249 RepID=A0A6I4NL45_9FLAO|nr:restriction endonuclease subunit S [Flavobacterium hydrocarbonoxydans]MWB95146.1 restriction endonuclease subunit S [Flavobacterium hydrocarbonoxydans]
MLLNYKRLGDFIKEVNIRNNDLKVKRLIGVSIEKKFINSVANVVGTDMSIYKIINKNQLACKLMSVGRDEKLPVDLYTNEEPSMISSAYYVFESISDEILLSEYLKMWLFRSETDRYVGYVSGGDVRGGISWDTFCDMPIVIPHIEKQAEIVREYHVIQNRMALNNQLITKLEETAQAIYKQWFVDFEFPDENGKPYKSNGNRMIWCEELEKEIPEGWKAGFLNHISKIEDGDRGSNYPSKDDMFEKEFCLFLGANNVSRSGFKFEENIFITKERDELLRKGKLKRHDIVFTTRGSSIGKMGYYSNYVPFDHIRINSGMVIFRCTSKNHALYLFTVLKTSDFQKEIKGFFSGSAQPQLPIKDIIKIPILIPKEGLIIQFSQLVEIIQDNIDIYTSQNKYLIHLEKLIFSKMTKVEIEKV